MFPDPQVTAYISSCNYRRASVSFHESTMHCLSTVATCLLFLSFICLSSSSEIRPIEKEIVASTQTNSSGDSEVATSSSQKSKTSGNVKTIANEPKRARATCLLSKYKLTLFHPGCSPRPVHISACRGSCRSSSVPILQSGGTQYSLQKRMCRCCFQLKSRLLTFSLLCVKHGTPFYHTVTVEAATRCSCQPCRQQ